MTAKLTAGEKLPKRKKPKKRVKNTNTAAIMKQEHSRYRDSQTSIVVEDGKEGSLVVSNAVGLLLDAKAKHVILHDNKTK